MGLKCNVPGCKSGYETREDEWKGKVTFHRFPVKEQGTCALWLKAVGRKLSDTFPGKWSAVCSLHFTRDDFTLERTDKNLKRLNSRDNKLLKRQRLKPKAVPTIFPDGPVWFEVVERVKKRKPKLTKQPKWMSDVPYCVVNQCSNDVMDLAKGVAFFRFPEDPMLREHWSRMCGHDKKWNPPPVARLCRDHFDPALNLAEPTSFKQDPLPVPLTQLQPLPFIPELSYLQPLPEEPKIKIVRSLRSCHVWKIFYQYYKSDLFCDLKIVCKNRKKKMLDDGSLLCHRLMLAAISPMLADALLASADDELSVVYLFDHRIDDVRDAVDRLYACLAQEREIEDLGRRDFQEIFADLGVDWVKLDQSAVKESTTERIKNEHDYDNGEFACGDETRRNDDFEEEVMKFDDGEGEEPLPEKRVRKRRFEVDQLYDWLDIQPKKKKAEIEHEFNEEVQVREAASVRENIMDRKKVSVAVKIVPDPYHPDNTSAAKRKKSLFMIMLGLKASGQEFVFNAVPIAISPKLGEVVTPAMIEESFSKFRNAATAIFGLSKVEATCQGTMFSRMEATSRLRLSQVKYDLERHYVNHTDEQLRELLTEEVLSVNSQGPIKPYFGEKVCKQGHVRNLRLDISYDLDLSDLDGMALVTFEDTGKKLAYSFNVEDDTRDADIQKLFKAFFDVFGVNRLTTGDKRTVYVPPVESIIKEAKSLEHSAAVFAVVHNYLKDVDRSKRESLTGLGNRICEDCGNEFEIRELQDMYRYQQHRRKHFFENYACDCSVSFKSLDDKKSHVQLVHLKGYTLCSHCGFVAKETVLKIHIQEKHEKFTCDQCGESIEGRTRFRHHMGKEHGVEPAVGGKARQPRRRSRCPVASRRRQQRRGAFSLQKNADRYIPTTDYNPHPDTSKDLKRTEPCVDCGNVYDRPIQLYGHWRNCHLEMECQDCGEKGIGDPFRKAHNRKAHPKDKDLSVNCKDCGKTIANEKCLLQHYYSVHAPESERPYACDECDRRFGSHSRLWTHQKRAHSSDRPYSCRYGCSNTFKEPSDRSGHENKKHGMSYPKYQAQLLQQTSDAS